MRRFQIIALLIVLVAIRADIPEASACSIFSLNRDGQVWFASNEDWPIAGFDIWNQPATDSSYGVLYIGFDGHMPACGINDQGLCFDIASVGIKYGPLDNSKRTSNRFVMFKVMESCASVEEALDSLAQYNIEFFSQSQLLIADRFGKSAVVESDTIIVRDGEGPQIITNFRHSEAGDAPAPCVRYQAIERILADSPASLETMRSAVAASHQETGAATQYSVAFDLKNLQLHIWLFHNYSDYVLLDLEQELAKERYVTPLSDLFPYQTTAYHAFVEKTKRPTHKAISLDHGHLDSLVGRYAIAPGYNIDISREGDMLFCRMFGMAPFELVPISHKEFFFKHLPASIKFDGKLSEGNAALRVVYPFGELPAKRAD